MEKCHQWQSLIEAELDGELADRDRELLAQHMATCASCRAYDRESRALQAALRALQFTPPVDLREPVMRALQRRRRWRRAGIVAVILTGLSGTLPALVWGLALFRAVWRGIDWAWLLRLATTVGKAVLILGKGWSVLIQSFPVQFWLGLVALTAFNVVVWAGFFARGAERGTR